MREINFEIIDDDMAAVLRRKQGWQRLAIVDALYLAAWSLIEGNVRANYPDWNDAQVRRSVAERIARDTD